MADDDVEEAGLRIVSFLPSATEIVYGTITSAVLGRGFSTG